MAPRLCRGAMFLVVLSVGSSAGAQAPARSASAAAPPAAHGSTPSNTVSEPPAAQVSAGAEGFAIRTADGSFRLALRGYVQSDARVVGATAALAGVDSFLLRRVRPVIEVTSYERFSLRIMPDFGEGRVTLQDAYAELRFGAGLRIRSGKFKAPFGLERLMSATELPMIERGAPTSLAPNRDLGVMVFGDVRGWAAYQVALLNGVADGGSADFDDNGGKDAVARVFAYPFRRAGPAALRGLGLGAAGSLGSETGTRSVPALPTFRTAGSQMFFKYRADGTDVGTVVAGGRRRRHSIQLQYYQRRFGTLAEWTATVERVRGRGHSADVGFEAWLVGTVIPLTGEPATPRGITPRSNFDPEHGEWGAFELSLRVSGFAAGADAFPLFADPAVSSRGSREAAVGVNWYLNRAVKLSTSVHRTRFSAGQPSTRPRAAEHVLLSRLQFAF